MRPEEAGKQKQAGHCFLFGRQLVGGHFRATFGLLPSRLFKQSHAVQVILNARVLEYESSDGKEAAETGSTPFTLSE